MLTNPERNSKEKEHKGKLGVRIIKTLWSDFIPTRLYGKEDHTGIDGYLEGESIQSRVVKKWIDNPEVFYMVESIGELGKTYDRRGKTFYTIFITWNKKEGFCTKIRTNDLKGLIKDLGLQLAPMGGPLGNGWGYWIRTEWLTPFIIEKNSFLVSEMEEKLGGKLN